MDYVSENYPVAEKKYNPIGNYIGKYYINKDYKDSEQFRSRVRMGMKQNFGKRIECKSPGELPDILYQKWLEIASPEELDGFYVSPENMLRLNSYSG